MKPKVLMFTGPYCKACDAMKPIVAELDYVEVKDVAAYPHLARQFGIRGGLPVFVRVDSNGDFISRTDGAMSLAKLRNFARW